MALISDCTALQNSKTQKSVLKKKLNANELLQIAS